MELKEAINILIKNLKDGKAIKRLIGFFKYGPMYDYGPWIQKVQIDKMEWAPGLWAGSEGAKFKVKSIDMENRIVEFEFIGME